MRAFAVLFYFENLFLLRACLIGILSSTAPGVSDIGDNIVGLFEHPVIAPGDGVVWVDGLNSLWEHCVGVVVVFGLLVGHIGQHNSVVDLWIFLH